MISILTVQASNALLTLQEGNGSAASPNGIKKNSPVKQALQTKSTISTAKKPGEFLQQ